LASRYSDYSLSYSANSTSLTGGGLVASLTNVEAIRFFDGQLVAGSGGNFTFRPTVAKALDDFAKDHNVTGLMISDSALNIVSQLHQLATMDGSSLRTHG
jgi:hypothetical protein